MNARQELTMQIRRYAVRYNEIVAYTALQGPFFPDRIKLSVSSRTMCNAGIILRLRQPVSYEL